METLDLISQYAIMILGPLSIFLISVKNKISRYGYLVGLISQVFWYITLIYHDQTPILISAVVYTISWLIGVWNYILKPWFYDKIKINLNRLY